MTADSTKYHRNVSIFQNVRPQDYFGTHCNMRITMVHCF